MFIKPDSYYIYNLSVEKLKLDKKHDGYKDYIEEKNKEKDKLENEIKIYIPESEFFINKKEIIEVFEKVPNALSKYISLVDEVYHKAYDTLEGDAAIEFEYECKKRKAGIFFQILFAPCGSLVNYLISEFGGDNTIEDIKEVFNNYRSRAIALKIKIFNRDGDYNTHFEDMANEVKGAIEEVNKIIDVLVSNIRDSGYVIDNYIISSFKSVLSIINKIAQNTNVSNVIIPGLKALTLSVFLILTIA